MAIGTLPFNHRSRCLYFSECPQYREASRSQKMLLLDTFVAMTGYVRKYAMWLLNHPVESRPSIPHARPIRYGPEIQQALYLA